MTHDLHEATAVLGFCLVLGTIAAHAEPVDSPELGLSMETPTGWLAQDTGTALLLTEPGVAGLYVIATHAHRSVEDLTQDPSSTRVADQGVDLTRVGPFERPDEETVAAHYQGTFDGVSVQGYAVSRLEPAGGGPSVLALAPEPAWSATHRQRARRLLRNIELHTPDARPDTGPVVTGGEFSGRRLMSIETSDTAYDGSGYRSREIADFCSDGRFYLYEQSSLSASVTGGSAAQRGASSLAAQWSARRRGTRYHVTLTNQDGSATMIVTPTVDEYGDRAFDIGDRRYYLAGEPDC